MTWRGSPADSAARQVCVRQGSAPPFAHPTGSLTCPPGNLAFDDILYALVESVGEEARRFCARAPGWCCSSTPCASPFAHPTGSFTCWPGNPRIRRCLAGAQGDQHGRPRCAASSCCCPDLLTSYARKLQGHVPRCHTRLHILHKTCARRPPTDARRSQPTARCPLHSARRPPLPMIASCARKTIRV